MKNLKIIVTQELLEEALAILMQSRLGLDAPTVKVDINERGIFADINITKEASDETLDA